MIEEIKLNSIIGLKISKVEQVDDTEIHFYTECGRHFKMYHEQDCCESVTIDDINGDLQNLVGQVIEDFSERYKYNERNDSEDEDYDIDSSTWTFYHISTHDTYIIIKWYGTSNGYYSESADFIEVIHPVLEYIFDELKYIPNRSENAYRRFFKDGDLNMTQADFEQAIMREVKNNRDSEIPFTLTNTEISYYAKKLSELTYKHMPKDLLAC